MTAPRTTPSHARPAAIFAAALVSLLLQASCGANSGSDAVATTAGPGTPSSASDDTAVPTTSPATTAPPTTAAPTTEAPTTTLSLLQRRADCVAALPVEQRAGQLLMLATTDLDAAQRLSGEGLVGGVTVLGQLNASLPDQLQAITAASEVAPMLAIDEEGGTVQRLEAILGPYPSASSVANDLDPQAAGAQFMAHAERVGDLGFTMILAPVADVGGGPGIGTRTFGTDPAVVGDYVVSHVQAISDAGLTPVVKHFPGHGRADADSHESLPTAPSLDQLREVDLLPFIEAFDAEAPSVMVGHLSVAGLTNGEPTSLSRAAVTGLLREELGYDGLVMTDSLGMGAVAGTTEEGEAALLAVQAGNDMAMVEREPQTRAAHQLLVAGVADGSLPEAQFNRSVERVLEAKGWPLCTDPEGVTP